MRIPTLGRLAGNKTGLQILTSCASIEEFVGKFRGFTSGSSVFVPTTAPVPVGVRAHFAIRLRNGETALSGLAKVIQSQSVDSALGTSRMAGMRLEFCSLDPASRPVMQWLGTAGKLLRAASEGDIPASATSTPSRPATADATGARAPGDGRQSRAVAAHVAAFLCGLAVAYQLWGA